MEVLTSTSQGSDLRGKRSRIVSVGGKRADGKYSQRLTAMRTTARETSTRTRDAHLGRERILQANCRIVNVAV